MKCPTALARLLALGTAAILFPLGAHAASYRWTLIEVEYAANGDPLTILNQISNPKAFSLMVSAGVVKITDTVTTECGADGVGSVDRTYGLRYAQSIDEAGRPQEFTTRRVGIRANVKELPQNTVELHLLFTELQGWIPFTTQPSFDALQPVFATRESTSTVSLREGASPIIAGIMSREEKRITAGKAPVSKKITQISIFEILPRTDATGSPAKSQGGIPKIPLVQQPTPITPSVK